MKNYKRSISIIIIIIVSLTIFSSCDDLLNPEQELEITEKKLYDDWYEYRSVEMGLYGLQSELVEQLVILGELRGDLMQITENADADMIEVYNFNISKENKYASPAKFFKLISACNNFIYILSNNHPEILDPNTPVTNFDKLYGEAICMRAWAYFNAVRIYGKIPFIHESLTTDKEIEDYINSSGTYIDSVHIVYGLDGYTNDTIYNQPISLEKQFFDEKLVIDYFTNELETKVKAVGVDHSINNNDNSWEVSIWNVHAMHTLLGIMYLTDGDLAKAAYYFEKIVYLPSENYRYQLDNSFALGRWKNIYNNIDPNEHIFTIWFNKSYFQQNRLQEFFDPRPPHKYMLKPTKKAILLWESMFDNYRMSIDDDRPWLTKTIIKGTPGDFYRGYGVSYAYASEGQIIDTSIVNKMLFLKSEEDYRTANITLGNVDTVVWKYSFNKDVFDQDANYILYRAAGVHLWLAETYVYWKFEQGGVVKPFTSNAVSIVNDGSNYTIAASRPQLGIRGRVGFGDKNDGIKVGNINYIHHPYTNEVTGYIDLTGKFLDVQYYLEELILDERARELAFEGERFYDLMRIAKKRNDPAFLASRVAQKFPHERRQEIYNYLLDKQNWYINIFD